MYFVRHLWDGEDGVGLVDLNAFLRLFHGDSAVAFTKSQMIQDIKGQWDLGHSVIMGCVC